MRAETRRSRAPEARTGWLSLFEVALVELGCDGWVQVVEQLGRLHLEDVAVFDAEVDRLHDVIPMCSRPGCPRCASPLPDVAIRRARSAERKDAERRFRELVATDRRNAGIAARGALVRH